MAAGLELAPSAQREAAAYLADTLSPAELAKAEVRTSHCLHVCRIAACSCSNLILPPDTCSCGSLPCASQQRACTCSARSWPLAMPLALWRLPPGAHWRLHQVTQAARELPCSG